MAYLTKGKEVEICQGGLLMEVVTDVTEGGEENGEEAAEGSSG